MFKFDRESIVSFHIRPVENRRDYLTFVHLPYQIYKGDPNWVPPLIYEERKKFSKKHNPALRHCDYQLFLLFHDNRPVGRISAFVDHHAVNHWNEKVGCFGSYECMEDQEGANLLLDTATNWLYKMGMETMRGPWCFDTKEWGFVVQGNDLQPMLMAPYNPIFYNDQMLMYGMKKCKALLAFHLDSWNGYKLPKRYREFANKVAEKTGVTIRPVNMDRLDEDVKTLLQVANASTAGNWGYVPYTVEEAAEVAKALKPIADPDIVLIAEVNGKPIGYVIAFPDVNSIIKKMKGRLFPFGFLKLVFGLKKIDRFRIWALGVIPEYQRKAVDVLFYNWLYDVLCDRDISLIEANYVLEDNRAMANPILKMGFRQTKKYQVYEAKI